MKDCIEDEVDETFESVSTAMSNRMHMFTSEPFGLYGGSFMQGENSKKKLTRDKVYRFYEHRLHEKEQTIDSMKY